MTNHIYKISILGILFVGLFSSCVPELTTQETSDRLPETYNDASGQINSATINWRDYFNDPVLISLIDTALLNNQELNIFLQQIQIEQNEVRARKGEYLPFVDMNVGTGVDKVGRYTRNGALEATTDIEPGKEFPEPLSDLMLGASVQWEVDVWKRLRNAKKSATMRYLATQEGKNFLVTNLIAEIADAYFELLALDNQLAIVQQNIDIQQNALQIVRLQKQSARVTELAVKRFEAEVLRTQSLQYMIRQSIIETENRINFLVGRYPQAIPRTNQDLLSMPVDTVYTGLPAQLLENRPDIRQAELELAAASLDVKSARANFFPRLDLRAGLGFQAFKADYLLTTPESLIYNLIGDISAPLINRNAIKATYNSADARQIQTVIDYEQTVLNAYIEVVNQLSNISNLQNSFDLQSRQVDALTESIAISNNLFRSARADYMEVLLTQRDALESRFDLVETKRAQMIAWVNMYRALGGGWN